MFSKLWNLNIYQIKVCINSISENTFMMHGAIFCLKCLVVCLEFLRTVCTVHHRPTGLHALWSELPNFVHKLMLHFFPSRMRALKFSNQWIHNGSESFAPGWNPHWCSIQFRQKKMIKSQYHFSILKISWQENILIELNYISRI